VSKLPRDSLSIGSFRKGSLDSGYLRFLRAAQMVKSNSCFCWPTDSWAFIIVVSSRFCNSGSTFSTSFLLGDQSRSAGFGPLLKDISTLRRSLWCITGCDGVSGQCSCGLRPEESVSFRRTSELARVKRPIPSPCTEDFDFSVLLSRADHRGLAIRLKVVNSSPSF
jgi:hypothetical protein